MYIDGVNLPVPANESELAATLAEADVAKLGVTVRGGGTKLGWGNPPSRACFYLSTEKLNHIVEHAWADMTATVEAGCTVGALQSKLAEHGQRLAVDPLWTETATIGGMLATNDTGALRLMYGGLRDLIIGVTLALPDGTLARAGGKVVKNVAGYDLMKLATGSLGTLGVITQATFRLYPLPRKTVVLTIWAKDIPQAQSLMVALLAEKLAITAMQMRAPSGAIDILLEGTDAGIAAQTKRIKEVAKLAKVEESRTTIFEARQELWDKPGAILKASVLPSQVGEASAGHTAIMQATGIGWLRVGTGTEIAALRTKIETMGGSLTVLRQPEDARVEAWGQVGDALPLMRAVKYRFDPHSTLNPGRYVGGI